MKRFQYGLVGILLGSSSIGTAGMIQDPLRVRLLGPLCGKLDSATVVKFDEQGRLLIDLSPLPPLTPEQKKTVCQIKVPYTVDNTAMNGAWELQAQYQQAQGSTALSTVRFAGVGTVAPARIWSITEPSAEPLAWKEAFELPDDGKDEDELKITWTSELLIPKTQEPPTGPSPEFRFKQIVIAPAL